MVLLNGFYESLWRFKSGVLRLSTTRGFNGFLKGSSRGSRNLGT